MNMSMMSRLVSRSWWYLRSAYANYVGFIIGFFGATSSVYYLAIKAVPELELIFPSYISFLIVMSIFGIPLTILIGYLHFKRSPMFKGEVEIQAESNIFNFRLLPGREQHVIVPTQTALILLLLKLVPKSLTEDEKILFLELVNRWRWLQKGGDIRMYRPQHDLDLNKVIESMIQSLGKEETMQTGAP